VKSLNGKVVLINLWATWCGPCNAKLPQLQKLYDQAKGRPDLQILTFNIDEDLGLVEPFVKEKGYTFPVVPAYSYVVNLLNGYAIPKTGCSVRKAIGNGPRPATVPTTPGSRTCSPNSTP
jgi:thiol-disulfide isomerase/thioredoxin